MTTLDPRGLEEAARVKCRQDEELMLLPDWGDLDGDQQDALRGEVSDIITAYLAVTQPIVETVEELEGLEEGTVIELRDGTTRIRTGWSSGWASAAAGDDHPDDTDLPARVIWRPHESP